jgi:DMSO/TMAO reductase YedYZ molybdopterin-dependent catalytic subunit
MIQRIMHGLRYSLRSPARTPRMAVVIGRLLAIAFLICFATGLYSHFIQDPAPWMVGLFPSRPSVLYQLTQGIHITAGIVCFPLLFGKLYSVYPALFVWPPVRSLPELLERVSIALFVAASLVQITIGLLNTYQAYQIFLFPFRQTHYALSFVIIGSLAIHIGLKLPIITRYWRKRDSYDEDGDLVVAEAEREDPLVGEIEPIPTHIDDQGFVVGTGGLTGRLYAWIDKTPAPRTPVTRRTLLAAIAASAATLVAFTAGQSFRGLDPLNILGPRKNDLGPNALPVNRTAKAAKVVPAAMSADWRLSVVGPDGAQSFSRRDLEALPQYDVELPIACVEGWSQSAQWRGPRVRDLMDAVGASSAAIVRATSLERGSIYAVSEMGPQFARDELTLVALEVNGQVLDLDHGYPARLIAPARPGVLQTKWLSSLEAIE